MSFLLVLFMSLVTTASAQSGCGEKIYYLGPSGSYSSPNYPGNYYNNLNCNIYVNSSSGASFSFIFKSFNTETNVDYVTISCQTNSSFSEVKLSGNSLPDPVSVPWCSQARVSFNTDNSVTDSGFTLDYFVSLGGCGNTLYGGSQGYVTSPNSPDSISPNQNCSNIIWAELRSNFVLKFEYLDLTNCNWCSCDYVELSCLDIPSSKERFCASATGEIRYFDKCKLILVLFHSDYEDDYGRFELEYNVTVDLTPTPCDTKSYYGPFGVISSPNYPGNYETMLVCDNNVYGSEGSSLTFIFSSFHVENFDSVMISCPINSTFPTHNFTGHTLPDPVSFPWCAHGFVNFRTDVSMVSTGFSLDYYISKGGCGETLFTGSSGYVTSPNYPSSYGYYQNCLNIIWAPQQSTVRLHFRKFDLGSCCECDWLDIRCIDNPANGTDRYCGNHEGYMLDIYECSQVLLEFNSDGANNYPGFQIEYIDPDAETPSVTSSTPSTFAPTETPSVASTMDSTPIVTPPTSTPTDCGETSYYGPSGVISSPNYPDSYSNNIFCDYYISASSSSSSTAIIFKAFDTEQCCDYVTFTCLTNSSLPAVRYSGSSLPQPFSIPWCSKAAVNFITNNSTVSAGFSLDYHISLGGCGDTVHTGSYGIVSSPNYPSSYANNQNCSNIIWASVKSSVLIKFLSMSVEECCDFVELSCLDNADYGSHRFTGSSIPTIQNITQCTQVLVWFYADGTVAQTGFNLEYLVTPE